ncbi:MAG: RnfABCDGE type electron transport complex subunit D [Oscillospiraceae bacterium]|nr:RnfABCDGE type electron transport complex subunit D [Oscillospiraceae bacterium]
MPLKKEPLTPLFKRFRAYLFSTTPLVGMAVYLYGLRPLIMVTAAVLLAVASDLLVAAMRKRRYDSRDLSSIMFAVTFTLMLPASVRYGIVIYGTLFTLLVKHAFGGYSGCVFQPAAFGLAAAAICWPDELFRYPRSFFPIGIGGDSGALLYDAPALTIKNGGIPAIDKMDFLLGNYPGPMAATFCVVLLAILVYLFACGVTSWHIPVVFLLTVAAYAFAFPRIPSTRTESMMYEILSGIIVFGAVYIVSDPITSPVNVKAKLLYGVLLGVATMLFNHFGVFQFGVSFAVLLINPLSPFLDRKFAPSKTILTESPK